MFLIGTREFTSLVRVEVNQIDFARNRFGNFYNSIGVFEGVVDVGEHDVLEEDSLLSPRSSLRRMLTDVTATIITIAKPLPNYS